MAEADDLLQSLIGESGSEGSGESVSTEPESSSETYQLPVRVGLRNQSLDDGGKPWIVGNFSPGVKTDDNHKNGHDGLDLKAPAGTPVYPMASGVVLDTGAWEKSGNYVKVTHENGNIETFYAHLKSVSCQKGQKVNQQTEIGTVGDSGNARGRGAHCHFQAKVNGNLVDPMGMVGKLVGSLSKKAMVKEQMIRLAEMFLMLSY